MLIYFYRVKGEGIVRLVKQIEPKNIDFQDIFTEDYKKLYSGKYCKINYINKLIKMRVETNFETNTFKVFINDDLCIGSHLNKNVLIEEKVGLVITGYSSLKSPM